MSSGYKPNARKRGQLRKRRVHRAWRRAATRHLQEAYNEKMRAEGHPGWTGWDHMTHDQRRAAWTTR